MFHARASITCWTGFALLAATAVARAEVYRVGNPPVPIRTCHSSLQDAVDAARLNPGPDTIRVTREIPPDAPGADIDDDANLTIEGGYDDCSDDTDDHGMTRFEAPGIAIRNLGNGTLTLQQLDLGSASNSVVMHSGGAMSIIDCDLHGTENTDGISASTYASLSIVDTAIHGNLIGVNATSGNLTITGSDIHDNSGAGVNLQGDVAATLASSALHDNGHGLLILSSSAATSLVDVDVFNNSPGGGIHVLGADANHPATLRIGANVDIHDNSGSSGGGVSLEYARLDMSNAAGSRIANNTAATYGGGIAIYGGSADIGSGDPAGTIAGNHAGWWGGGVSVTGGAQVRLFTTDPAVPNRIVGNSAGGPDNSMGGGIAVLTSMAAPNFVYALDVSIENNEAATGGAIGLLQTSAASARSVLCLSSIARPPNSCEILEAPVGAVPCSDPTRCTRLYANRASTASGSTPPALSAQGAAIAHSGGAAQIYVHYARIEQHEGASVFFQSVDEATGLFAGYQITDALIVDNTVAEAIVTQPDFGYFAVWRSTIAGNSIGGSAVISASGDVELKESIVYQPGTIAYSGPSETIDAEFVLSHETASLPQHPGIFAAEPRFNDAHNGDYRLREDSPALDVSDLAGSPIDLDGAPRGVDLPTIPNFAGPRDLGAFERQTFTDAIFANGFDDAG